MAVRIELSSLGDEVRRRLAAGETVEVEDKGRVVAEVAPRHAPGTLGEFLAGRVGAPTLDYADFIHDVEAIRAELNATIDPSRWG